MRKRRWALSLLRRLVAFNSFVLSTSWSLNLSNHYWLSDNTTTHCDQLTYSNTHSTSNSACQATFAAWLLKSFNEVSCTVYTQIACWLQRQVLRSPFYSACPYANAWRHIRQPLSNALWGTLLELGFPLTCLLNFHSAQPSTTQQTHMRKGQLFKASCKG